MKNLIEFLNTLLKNTSYAVVGKGKIDTKIIANMGVGITARWRPKWKIEKYNAFGELYAVEEFAGNMLLAEGVTEMWNLIAGKSFTHFDSANSYLGVGDGTAEPSASQKGLQGANKFYKRVDETYPQVNNQSIVFRATFGTGEAAFVWQEFTVCNSNSDSGINLCRKVETHGTKAVSDTWVLSLSITLS